MNTLITFDVVGIDPGLKGGLVYATGRIGQAPEAKMASRMPTTEDEARQFVSGGTRHLIDVWKVIHFMNNALHATKQQGREGSLSCIIERAQAMPKQGVSGMFNYGFNHGLCTAVAMLTCDAKGANLGGGVYTVRPNVWKSDLGLEGGSKDASRRLATEIYGTDKPWKMKRDEGVAEAALIAFWRLNRLCSAQRKKLI